MRYTGKDTGICCKCAREINLGTVHFTTTYNTGADNWFDCPFCGGANSAIFAKERYLEKSSKKLSTIVINTLPFVDNAYFKISFNGTLSTEMFRDRKSTLRTAKVFRKYFNNRDIKIEIVEYNERKTTELVEVSRKQVE